MMNGVCTFWEKWKTGNMHRYYYNAPVLCSEYTFIFRLLLYEWKKKY